MPQLHFLNPGYFGRLLIPSFAVDNSRSLHYWLAAVPTVGIWLATAGVCLMSFNLNDFNFNHSVLDSRGQAIPTDADIVNRANLGIQAMDAPNTHHFPSVI